MIKSITDFAEWLVKEVFIIELDILYIILLIFPIWIAYMAIKDVFFNKTQTIKHNFPVVGRLRYFLESIGPELRQYIVANNREELPFNRSQRSWIYASSKRENNYEGFGTDKDILSPGHVFINPAMFAYRPAEGHPNTVDPYFLPCAKVMGEGRRRRPYRPYSVSNISAMSFGSLSANAISALNKGSKMVGSYHNTGEGSLSPYHQNGSDIMLQFGTGYFGVRDHDGNFDMDRLVKLTSDNPYIRCVEIKLSQGAKPGKGGILPAAKINKEIAQIRNLPMGKDAVSPPYHTAFTNVPELVDFIENAADQTGIPIGIKSAVGQTAMWEELADLMAKTGKGPDFIAIDGGEGGTGAAPHSFADHVSLPFLFAFTTVYKIFLDRGLTDRVVFVASGKLGLPAQAMMAFALGADLIAVGREAMLSIGCIQAQICHTNSCPAGVATQSKWLQSGLNPAIKAVRYYNYMRSFRKEVLEMSHACNYEHPCQLSMTDVEVGMGDAHTTRPLSINFGYEKHPVPFKGMQSLLECPHLGGLGTGNLLTNTVVT